MENNLEKKPLSCPHCKSKDTVLSTDGEMWWGACWDCQMEGPIVETDLEALKTWNNLSQLRSFKDNIQKKILDNKIREL